MRVLLAKLKAATQTNNFNVIPQAVVLTSCLFVMVILTAKSKP